MDSILLVFLCLVTGILLKRFSTFPANTHLVLNQFVIWVSLPALALFYIPKIAISTALLFPLSIGWLNFLFAFLFFYALGKILGFSKKLTGCLILMCGLGNTSFVGFPIIEALYGKEGLETAIIVDQPGTFVAMSTVGILVASAYSRGSVTASGILLKMLKFPPLLAFLLALLLNFFKADFPEILQSAFLKLSVTVTPLALVAVGFQLQIQRRSRHWGMISLALLFKLVLIPAIFFAGYFLLMGKRGVAIEVCILESAMAPMVTAAILCHQFGLKPRMASTILGIGIPVSLLTVGIWYYLLTIS